MNQPVNQPAKAANSPVRRPAPEVSSTDMPIEQKPKIIMADDGPVNRESIITSLETPLADEYAELLKFGEEPITILINPSQERNAPVVVDCWVNGKGAEVFINGKWMVFNCLPVGKMVVTRRKYVEVLLRSKRDTVNTIVDDATVETPRNEIHRVTSSNVTLQVIGDTSPKGAEWMRRLMRQAD